MRSFGLVEDKIRETDFFLNQIKYCDNFFECKCYLNAFLSACRSITFVLQASMKKVPEFDKWYDRQQQIMKDNELSNFFATARTESQKIGTCHICSGSCYKDIRGEIRMQFYFEKDFDIADFMHTLFIHKENGKLEHSIEDVATQCENHFKFILEIVYDCFNTFGHVIDPKKYYTLGNIQNIGLSVEDVEGATGYPRGWTDIEGYTPSDRVDLIRCYEPDSNIDPLFVKYLNKRRYST